MKKIFYLIFCAVLLSTLSRQYTYAALGGGLDSISSDLQTLHANHRAKTIKDKYSVEKITADATTVREYVSPSGIVFGIAWNGYVHPDLTRLLGSYSGEFTAARQKAARIYGSRRLHLATENIIVEKWGHMRDLQGRAYAPSLFPKGITSDEIK
ncbi:MAG: DUF2844 domain-containing protein [Oryzomonas sp.]|jgi:hypothetical protein